MQVVAGDGSTAVGGRGAPGYGECRGRCRPCGGSRGSCRGRGLSLRGRCHRQGESSHNVGAEGRGLGGVVSRGKGADYTGVVPVGSRSVPVVVPGQDAARLSRSLEQVEIGVVLGVVGGVEVNRHPGVGGQGEAVVVGVAALPVLGVAAALPAAGSRHRRRDRPQIGEAGVGGGGGRRCRRGPGPLDRADCGPDLHVVRGVGVQLVYGVGEPARRPGAVDDRPVGVVRLVGGREDVAQVVGRGRGVVRRGPGHREVPDPGLDGRCRRSHGHGQRRDDAAPGPLAVDGSDLHLVGDASRQSRESVRDDGTYGPLRPMPPDLCDT